MLLKVLGIYLKFYFTTLLIGFGYLSLQEFLHLLTDSVGYFGLFFLCSIGASYYSIIPAVLTFLARYFKIYFGNGIYYIYVVMFFLSFFLPNKDILEDFVLFNLFFLQGVIIMLFIKKS